MKTEVSCLFAGSLNSRAWGAFGRPNVEKQACDGNVIGSKSAVKVPLGNFWELKPQLSPSYSSGAA